MSISLAIMGVILFALILVGFFVMITFRADYFNTGFLVFYFLIMSLLSIFMMNMVKPV